MAWAGQYTVRGGPQTLHDTWDKNPLVVFLLMKNAVRNYYAIKTVAIFIGFLSLCAFMILQRAGY